MRDTFRMILSGSRPRTWALSLCPVLIAALSAFHDVHAFEKTKRIPSWAYFMQHDGRLILLSAVVAVSLQVCANFANDYLDGVRGIDKARSADAPARLNSQASGIRIARCAAIVSATIGACAGIAAVLVSKQYWLIAVGIICIGAAWSYSSFFSARGWGETLAFIFFGPGVSVVYQLATDRSDWQV